VRQVLDAAEPLFSLGAIAQIDGDELRLGLEVRAAARERDDLPAADILEVMKEVPSNNAEAANDCDLLGRPVRSPMG